MIGGSEEREGMTGEYSNGMVRGGRVWGMGDGMETGERNG